MGIITDPASGKIDLFIGVNNSGSRRDIGIWKPGTGSNTSPSTTSIDNSAGSPKFYAETATNYNWAPVSLITDPSVGTATDLDAGGGNDYFLSFSVPFSDIVAALAANGITGITEDSKFSYVVATSQQGNALNQDLNGVSGNINSALTWGALGALGDPTSPVAAVPEANPATVVSLLFAFVFGFSHYRRLRNAASTIPWKRCTSCRLTRSPPALREDFQPRIARFFCLALAWRHARHVRIRATAPAGL